MERSNFENYEQVEQESPRTKPESAANTLGGMVVNLVLVESIFGGLGAATGVTAFGAPETFSHTLSELAGVNNIAYLGYDDPKELQKID